MFALCYCTADGCWRPKELLEDAFLIFLPCHGSGLSPLLPSLLSLTADQSHFSLCSTPSKTFIFLSRSFSLQLSHLLPPCCYINFTETKKQGPQGWLDVKGRRGASMRGEQMQRVVSSHMLYEKDVENWSNWLYFMEEPSFPPSNLQQKLLSEENAEKNFYWH